MYNFRNTVDRNYHLTYKRHSLNVYILINFKTLNTLISFKYFVAYLKSRNNPAVHVVYDILFDIGTSIATLHIITQYNFSHMDVLIFQITQLSKLTFITMKMFLQKPVVVDHFEHSANTVSIMFLDQFSLKVRKYNFYWQPKILLNFAPICNIVIKCCLCHILIWC